MEQGFLNCKTSANIYLIHAPNNPAASRQLIVISRIAGDLFIFLLDIKTPVLTLKVTHNIE
jgi:hypothetical protein